MDKPHLLLLLFIQTNQVSELEKGKSFVAIKIMQVVVRFLH